MKTANGAELLASHMLGIAEDFVILVRWHDHYVTARIIHLTDKEWYWGNYFPATDAGFSRAFADFMRRSGKAVEPVE